MSRGEAEESPSPAVPALGPPAAHLPPIKGCFSSRAPDLPGICCNLAGSAPWPAGTACRMRPRCGRERGLRVGVPPFGPGSAGELRQRFLGTLCRCRRVGFWPKASLWCPCAAAVPAPSSSAACIPGGFSMTLRGWAPTNVHFLAPWTCWDPLGWAGTAGMGWGRFHAAEGVPREGSRSWGAAGGRGKPPRCASRMPQTKGAGQDPASLAPAASVSSDRAAAAQPSCPGEPCGPRTAGRAGGCPPRPPAARAAPPQPASPGTPDGRDFLGKVPSGDTRLRRGRPWRWRVPLAWFCRPASGTPGDVALGVPLASPGVSPPPRFRAGGSHPQSAGAGGGTARSRSALPRPVVWLLGWVLECWVEIG